MSVKQLHLRRAADALIAATNDSDVERAHRRFARMIDRMNSIQ
jgi:hypothetical protein